VNWGAVVENATDVYRLVASQIRDDDMMDKDELVTTPAHGAAPTM